LKRDRRGGHDRLQAAKFRGICRGLIEAPVGDFIAPRRRENSAASAAASLKQQKRKAQAIDKMENSAASAAASLKREALTHTPGGRSENSAASAAASLKRRLVEEDRTTARRKFRGICRGLIEATSKRAPPTAGLLKIPRHLPRPH